MAGYSDADKIGENVAGFIGLALDQVLSDLENKGYETRAFVLPACSVGAAHRRDRCAIVGFDANSIMGASIKKIQEKNSESGRSDSGYGGRPFEDESRMDRVLDGVPYRMDRLKCLGNAVVPAQFYPIFKSISMLEHEN